MSVTYPRFLAALLIALCLSAGVTNAQNFDADLIPQVGNEARQHLTGKYAKAREHKAFVIGPAGAWQWKSGKSSPQAAIDAALSGCNKRVSPLSCMPYAVDDEVVFDPGQWEAILFPYPTAEEAASAAIGSKRDQQLPDITFTTPDGQSRKLSDYRGKTVVFHIWGSWCPPCQYEMPSLNRLYEDMKNNPDIVFIPVGVKETFSTSKRWTDRQGFTLPFVNGDAFNGELTLANGDEIDFREIAPKIPTTFFLDRNGVVVYRKVTAFRRWEDFKPQLEHLIAHGAR